MTILRKVHAANTSMYQYVNGIDDPVSNLDTSLSTIYGIVLNVMFGVGIGITMIFLIMSGIRFITSKGDFKATAKAKDSLTYAMLGLILVIFSYALRTIMLNSLGIDNPELVNDTPGF